MIGKDNEINISSCHRNYDIRSGVWIVDAALTKSSFVCYPKIRFYYSVYSRDIAAGDKCCPAVVAQTEYLLVNKNSGNVLLF